MSNAYARARAKISGRMTYWRRQGAWEGEIVRGILDRHRPLNTNAAVCRQCDYLWPCPDVRAVYQALGVTDE